MTATPNNEATGVLDRELIACALGDLANNDASTYPREVLAEQARLLLADAPAPSARDADGEVVAWEHKLADALEHFWNPAVGAIREASYHGPASGSDVVGAIAQGFAAMASALRESTPKPTPPASVPVAELVALAEKWRQDANGAARYSTTEHEDGRILEQRACADELTALAQKGDARGADR